MLIGEKFLQKQYRKRKPKPLTISTLSLLQSYENMLHTLNVLKPGETVVAADVNGQPSTHIQFNIYTNKEVQSRTRKD
jgi:hypothetical protein